MGPNREKEKRRRLASCQTFLNLALIFVSFAFFVGNSSAQDLDSIRTDLASGNTELKRNALFQIKDLHTEAASRLAIPALSDIDELVRATATTAVIFLPKAQAVQLLLSLLNDKAPFVRNETAFALGEIGDASATSPLVHSLQKDSAAEVRSAAAVALGKIGDPAAIDALTTILKKKPANENDSNEYLRRSVARSIGQIAQIIKTSKSRVTTPQDFLPTKYKETAGGEPVLNTFPVFRNAVVVLTNVLQNNKEADDTRREAAFALGAIGDESSVALLRSYLNSPDIYLAEICKEALIKLGQGI